MEASGSPRRILADRDVNKPVVKSPSILKTSPLKPSPFPNNTSVRSNGLEMAQLAKPLISAKAGAAEASTIPIGSKRGIVCLGDVPEGPSQKQVVNEAVNFGCKAVATKASHLAPRIIASDDIHERVEGTAEEPEIQQIIRESPSPDSPFNTTEDYWNEDSQNTTLTEPDLVPPNIPTFTISHAPARRTISPQEARENAEALRLRLKMAMYKIKTNQTDLPLSQVQIRRSYSSSSPKLPLYSHPHPQSQSMTRKPLPTGPSIPTHTQTIHHDSIDVGVPTTQSSEDKNMCSKLTEQKGPSVPSRNADSAISPVRRPTANEDNEEYLTTPNSSPSRTTTRDTSHPNHEVEGEEGGEHEDRNGRSLALTSNLVQGSAADGLLSLSARATLDLMGCN